MPLDDILPQIGPASPDHVDVDAERDDAVARMKARTSAFVATLAADKTGRKNAARIDALVDEAQARYDKAAAAEAEAHRERVRLNDLYEFRYGRRPPAFAASFPVDPNYEDEFSRFQREELERREEAENAEAEREYARVREARRVEAEAYAAERAVAREAEEDARAWRQTIRHQIRGGAPGRWDMPRSGNDPNVRLPRRGYVL